MKTVKIILEDNGEYRVELDRDEKTPSGLPIYQTSMEKALEEVFGTVKRFYEDDSGEKKK